VAAEAEAGVGVCEQGTEPWRDENEPIRRGKGRGRGGPKREVGLQTRGL